MTEQSLALPFQRVAAPARNVVVETIREWIVHGSLKPGERILERKLCTQLQASRTTIREALRHLESDGLIFVIPGKGPIVRNYTRAEIEDLYRAREVLEVLAVSLFMERADPSAIVELENAHMTLASRYAEGDVRRILAAKDYFYGVIFSGARSEILRSLLQRIEGQTARFRGLSLSQPERTCESAKEIHTIVNAIMHGDRNGAAQATALHVQRACRAALSALETQRRA